MDVADGGYRVPFPEPSLAMAAADFRPPPPPGEIDDPEILELGEAVFEAAIDADLWVDWLARVARAFGCPTAHVALFDFQRSMVMLHAISSQDFDIPAQTLKDYEAATPVDERAGLAAAFPGRALTSDDFDPEQLARIPVVQFAPPELGQLLMVNDPADPYWALLSVLKHRDAPRFTEAERQRLTALGVPFRRAIRLFRAWEASMKAGGLERGTLESLDVPLALFTAQGEPVLMNSPALGLMGLNSEAGWVAPRGWKAVVEEAGRQGRAQLDLAGPRGATLARLVRLPGEAQPLLLEMDVDPDSRTLRIDRFCAHYGLSPAERAVLELLAEGTGIDDIASQRKTSRETVRSQLRAIREKSGITSQHETVAALAAFAGPRERAAA